MTWAMSMLSGLHRHEELAMSPAADDGKKIAEKGAATARALCRA